MVYVPIQAVSLKVRIFSTLTVTLLKPGFRMIGARVLVFFVFNQWLGETLVEFARDDFG